MAENKARICVPVCVQRASELAQAVACAGQLGNMIELRLDCFKDEQLNAAMSYLPPAMARLTCPIIFTFQKNQRSASANTDFFETGSGASLYSDWCYVSHEGRSYEPDFADWDFDLVLGNQYLEKLLGIGQKWDRIICSHHDFVGVPVDLDAIYARMAATPARILKIAVQADDAVNCLPVFHLLERAQSEGREMIAIAMGQAGVCTRILGPSRGSFLTYGSLDDESATAPGQLKARDLREVYRIDHIDQQTDIMGLIGSPVARSISPNIHNAAFAAAGLNAVYVPLEVRDVNAFMRRMVHPRSREIDWKMRGLSVTVPHKTAVMQHLDWIEPEAKEIGAVNTIVVAGDDLHGYNTDADAFIAPLRNSLGSLKDARCAIIGAGGAARSALWVLRKEGAIASLFVRDIDRSRTLATAAGVECSPLNDATFDGFDVVVNATPLGTRGPSENEAVANAQQLRGVRLVYDLVYNPSETKLMQAARAAGCAVLGGLEMLLAQAAAQFKLWTGRDAGDDVMRAAAKKALTNSGN